MKTKSKLVSLKKMSNQKLWELFPIILSRPKKYWAKRYELEQSNIVKAIGSQNICRINHIGSTSVEGLLAKPTIDILLEITSKYPLKQLKTQLLKAGYLYSHKPENPSPHMMFMKGYTNDGFKGQAYHLHVRYLGDWNELYFRDYLKAHNDVAHAYGELKLSLKEKYEHNRDAYTEAKTDFISRYTELARKEFLNRYDPEKILLK